VLNSTSLVSVQLAALGKGESDQFEDGTAGGLIVRLGVTTPAPCVFGSDLSDELVASNVAPVILKSLRRNCALLGLDDSFICAVTEESCGTEVIVRKSLLLDEDLVLSNRRSIGVRHLPCNQNLGGIIIACRVGCLELGHCAGDSTRFDIDRFRPFTFSVNVVSSDSEFVDLVLFDLLEEERSVHRLSNVRSFPTVTCIDFDEVSSDDRVLRLLDGKSRPLNSE